MENKKMDGEQKMWTSLILAFAAVLISAIVLGMQSCNQNTIERGKVLEKCLGMGKSPVECEQVAHF